MPDTFDQLVSELSQGVETPPTSRDFNALVDALAPKPTSPDTPLDNQIQQTIVSTETEKAELNKLAAAGVASGLSMWDDFRVLSDPLANTTKQETAERIFRFAASQGHSVDASIMKGVRLDRLHKDVSDQFIRFMDTTGYKGVANDEESKQIFDAFLFKEMIGRMRPSAQKWEQGAEVAFDTLVQQQLNYLGQNVQPGGDYAQRFEALAQLKALKTPQKIALMNYAHRSGLDESDLDASRQEQGAPTRNEPSMKHSEREAWLTQISTAFGTDEPSRLLADMNRKTQTAMRFKDLGFIDGDITKHGILTVDPTAPGGLTPLSFLQQDVINNLETKLNESRLAGAGKSTGKGHTTSVPQMSVLDAPVETRTVQQFIGEFGESLGREKLARVLQVEREQRVEQVAATLSMKPGPETTDPEHSKALAPHHRAVLWVAQKMDAAFTSAVKAANGIDEVLAQSPKAQDVSKTIVLGLTKNPRLAAEATSFGKAYTLITHALMENGRLTDTAADIKDVAQKRLNYTVAWASADRDEATLAELGRQMNQAQDRMMGRFAVVMEGIGNKSGAELSGFTSLDQAAQIQIFEAANSGAAAMAAVGADADAEQDARSRRMADYTAGRGGTAGGYLKDTAATLYYQVGQQVRQAVGDIVDSPATVAANAVTGAVMGLGVKTMAAARTKLSQTLLASTRIREASKIVAQRLPVEYDRVLENLNGAISAGKDVNGAMKRAAAEMSALKSEAEFGAQVGVVSPNLPGSARFARDMARAWPHLGEFKPDVIQHIVEGLPDASKVGLPVDIYRAIKSTNATPISSVVANTQTAKTMQALTVQTAKRLLDVNPGTQELSVLRANLARAEAVGDTAAIAENAAKISKLGSMDGPASPLDSLRLIQEKDGISVRMKALNEEITRLEGEAARQTLQPDVQQYLHERQTELAGITRRHTLITDQIRNGPALNNLDVAQLLLAQDTGKLGWGFFSRAGEMFHNGIARLFGTRDFATIKQAQTAADRLTSFATQQANDWIDAKARHGTVKMRNDLLYRRTRHMAQLDADALDAQAAVVEGRLAGGGLTPDEVEALSFEAETARGAAAIAHTEVLQLGNEQAAMNALPAGEAWTPKGKLIEKFLTEEDLASVIANNPEHFDNFDVEGILPVRPEEMAAMQARLPQLRGVAAQMDEELPYLASEVERMGPEYTRIQDKRRAQPRKRKAARIDPLDPDAPTPKPVPVEADPDDAFSIQYEKTATRRDALVGQRRRLQQEIERIERAAAQPDGNAQARVEMRKLFEYEGIEQQLRDDIAALRADAEAAANAAALGSRANPIMDGEIPLHMKGLTIWDNLLTTKHRLQERGLIAASLTDALNHMTPLERRAVRQAIRRGATAEQIATVDPHLAHELELMSPDGRATFTRNVDNYVKNEAQFQVEALEQARLSGMISEADYRALKKRGYDPHLYGIHEGSSLVQSGRVEEARMAFKQKGGSGDKPELKFQRDLKRWRARVQEPDGYVHDKLFPSGEAAREYVQKNFGEVDYSPDDVGYTASTRAGGRITVAKPIGEDVAQMLGFQPGMSPERRVARFAQLHRDVAMHQFLSATRAIPGMVLTPKEFARLLGKAGAKHDAFGTQFMELPANKEKFGNLAGHYVHRKVLSEVNAMQHNFSQMQSWVQGAMEVYGDFTKFTPRLFGKLAVAGPKTLQTFNRLVKTSQILLSWKTWVGNMTSNVFADSFVGGRVFATENLDNLGRAIDEVFTGSRKPRDFLGNPSGGDFHEAVRLGVVGGGIYDKSNQSFHKAFLRAVGFDEAPKVQRHVENMRMLQKQEILELQKAGKTDSARLREVELALVAGEEALKDFDAKRMRRFARDSFRFFLMDNKDRRGLAASQFGDRLRERYGMSDDIFRYASFLNLKRQGMTGAQAAARIADFAQNYGNVPASISNLSRSAVGSLVPMFPYEQARLMKNYALKQPLKLLGMLSIIPAINAISAGLAGVPAARIAATHRASGQATTMDMVEEEMTTLTFFDPVSHEASSRIGFGRTLMPAFQVASDYGALSAAAKAYFPPEDDTFTANVGRTLARMGSSFVLNNPLVNTGASFVTGTDPATGRPWTNDAMGGVDRIGYTLRGLAKTIVPPWAPMIGRIAAESNSAWATPIHPETGKPYGTPQLGSVILREATGLNVKGRLAKDSAAVFRDFVRLAGGQPNEEKGPAVSDELLMISMMYAAQKGGSGTFFNTPMPLYGMDAEKRKFSAMLRSDASTPEQKAAAEEGLMKMAAKEREIVVNGTKYVTGKTAREQAAYLKRARERGAVDHFAQLNLMEQTITLIEANKVGINNSTLENYAESVRLSDRWRDKQMADPDQINQSMALLEGWVREPRCAPANKEWYNWLCRIQGRSINARRVEVIREAKLEQLRAEGRVR